MASTLGVSQVMKAEGSGDTYAEARRESIMRNNARLNGALPDAPEKGQRNNSVTFEFFEH